MTMFFHDELVAMLDRLLAGPLYGRVLDITNEDGAGASPREIAVDCNLTPHGVDGVPGCPDCSQALAEYDAVRAAMALATSIPGGQS